MNRLFQIAGALCAAILFLAVSAAPGLAAAPDAVSLPDGFFPEGVAAGADGDLYVGSLSRGAILRVPKGASAAEPFIAPGTNGLVSVIGLLADPERDALWACSSDPGVGDLTGSAAPSLTAFRLSDGAPLKSFPMGKGAFCNDMALAPDGAVYVTDSFNPVIRRASLDTGRMEVWLENPRFVGAPPAPKGLGDPFNLNGVVFGPDGALYAVKTNTGELFRIVLDGVGNPASVEEVALPRPLEGPDGLKALPDGGLLVVEGADRLTRIDLSAEPIRLETVAKGFDFATTTTLTEDGVWVVEGQLDRLFLPEKAKDAPKPFKLTRAALPAGK
jgi:streptogramin lyase